MSMDLLNLDVHALGQLCKGNPANLPDIVVWKLSHFAYKGAKVGASGRIHMSEATLEVVRLSLPIKLIRILNPVQTLFQFDAEQLNALWGSGDALVRPNNDHHAMLRTMTGHRGTDGAPIHQLPKTVETDRGLIKPIMMRPKVQKVANDNSK